MGKIGDCRLFITDFENGTEKSLNRHLAIDLRFTSVLKPDIQGTYRVPITT